MNWATLGDIGQFGTLILAVIIFIRTSVRTSNKTIMEKVESQVDKKILTVNSELKLVKQQFTSLKEIIDVKLDSIKESVEKTETLLQNHIERN